MLMPTSPKFTKHSRPFIGLLTTCCSPVSPVGKVAKSSVPLCRRGKSFRCKCLFIADSSLCCGTVQNGIGSCRGKHPRSVRKTPRLVPGAGERKRALGWRGTHKDPFKGEWERITSWLQANPERSSGDIFRELQRLSPGRYQPLQIRTLQRGMRKIRANPARKPLRSNGRLK
jgi:hypothetical protein